MTLQRSNRSFYGLLLLAAAPFLALGLLGCGVLVQTLGRLVAVGPAGFDGGPLEVGVTVFLTAGGFGIARGLHRLATQLRATRNVIGGHAGERGPAPTWIRSAARSVGLDRIELIDDDSRYSYTYGLLQPTVTISSGLVDALSESELGAVLAHEAFHVANRDPLKIAVARAITAGLWFVPAAHHLLGRYRADRELDADRHAAARTSRKALAGAILRATEGPPVEPPVGALAAFSGADLFEARITQIETGQPGPYLAMTARQTLASAVGFAVLVAGMVLTSVALDVRSILLRGGYSDLLGAAGCAAMWLLVADLLARDREPSAT